MELKMDDKWFFATIMFAIGVTGILIYLLYKKDTVTVEQPITTYIPMRTMETSAVKPISEFFTMNYAISDSIMMLDEKSNANLPWTSIDLTNNGPNPVYCSINNHDNMESPIPVGQSINIDLKQKGEIKKIYFKCSQGETANIRLYVVK